MKKKFLGYWVTFEFLDDLCDTIKDLREAGYDDLTTHAPCPRHEIDHSLGDPQSRVPFFTLFFGAIGVITAYTLANWMSVDWVLPVSSKPLVTFIPYTIIAFELMVLFGAYGTMLGVVLLIARGSMFKSHPKSEAYLQYDRFTKDRFGLIVRCGVDDFSRVEELLKKYNPEEIHNES